MKKILLIITLAAMPFIALLAQQQEKLETLKIAFITRQLNLTPDEAQKFWPVYNQYVAETKKAHQEHVQKNGGELEWQQKSLDIKKKYKPEFLKTISAEKFEKLLTIEKDWKDKLRQELDRRKQMRQDRKGANDPM